MTGPGFCPKCGSPFGMHTPECAIGKLQAEAQREKDCKLGARLLEAIDKRDTVLIGRVLRGEL